MMGAHCVRQSLCAQDLSALSEHLAHSQCPGTVAARLLSKMLEAMFWEGCCGSMWKWAMVLGVVQPDQAFGDNSIVMLIMMIIMMTMMCERMNE